jgi:hypothetical protein
MTHTLEIITNNGINSIADNTNKTITIKADEATSIKKGVIRLAADNEMNIGTDTTIVPTVKQVADKLSNKVDKVAGKGLSTNDFSTAEKAKLAGIANNATNTKEDTAETIKSKYESNTNTNAFTDEYKTMLDTLPPPKSPSDIDLDFIPVDHTGYVTGFAYSQYLRIIVATVLHSRIYTSFNGVLWTERGSFPDKTEFRDVAWSPDLKLFVAVCSSATEGEYQAIYTSPNGISWTHRTSKATTGLWTVEWIPTLKMFIAAGDSSVIITSLDGILWTVRQSPLPEGNNERLWNIAASPFIVCISGLNSEYYTTTNGKSWTSREGDGKSRTRGGHIWIPEENKFVGVNMSQIKESYDGIDWKLISSLEDRMFTITWSPDIGLFLVGGSGGLIKTSVDLINWKQHFTIYFKSNEHVNASIYVPELKRFILGGGYDIFTTLAPMEV